MPGPVRNPAEAFQQLEAIMLRQMLQSSGAFKAGSTPGAQLRTDMFVETLADAVAKAGGLGIARMLEHQLGGSASASPAPAPTGLLHPFHGTSTGPAAAPSGSFAPSSTSQSVQGVDDLDDPNSEAPLPEDPNAPSIDEFQWEGRGGSATSPHLPVAGRRSDHPAASASGLVPLSVTRALNRYRERAEAPHADSQFGVGIGEKP